VGRSSDRGSLVFDWNGERSSACDRVELNDETLRDGLQSPSATEPADALKRRLVHLMAELGIGTATIGFPAAGPRMLAQCRLLAREVASTRLPLALTCAARAAPSDLAPIVELAQETGLAIEAAAFIGTSAVRQAAEGWALERMLSAVDRAVAFGTRAGIPVMFVAEDASRAHPDTLAALCLAALRAGAGRICLADTTGYATPAGVTRLVGFVRERVTRSAGAAVGLDWHGHRDRGLALANCLAAIAAGADRVHATALGIGERAGNAEMEQLLANLYLLGATSGNLQCLPEYCRTAAAALGIEIPAHHPVVGADAFRTGTGLHAAVILKAQAAGDSTLADLLYSSLPAAAFGLVQQIAVTPASGRANVRSWLAAHGYDPDDAVLADGLLAAAKRSDRALSDAECAVAVADALARAAVHD
jgi:isopropylmalate/homocitrate/citramalate synthase